MEDHGDRVIERTLLYKGVSIILSLNFSLIPFSDTAPFIISLLKVLWHSLLLSVV